VHRRSGYTLTTYYFVASIFWSLALIFVLLGWYAVEKYVFLLKGSPIRMVRDPTEFAVRIAGLAHFIIAALFLVTSLRLRTASGWAWLVGLSGISVLQCWGFAALGGHKNALALIAFYMYFVIHAFRDEAFFYRVRSGPTVPPEPQTESVLQWLQVLAICVLIALLVSTIAVAGQLGLPNPTDNALRRVFPSTWSFMAVFGVTAVPMTALATLVFARIQTSFPGGFVGLYRTHTPLIKVIGFTMLIMLSSMLVGAWTYNLVIVMHFVAWFVFTTSKISALPPAVRQAASWRQPMDWFKRSLLGFSVLHVGLSLFFLTLIAINHYGLQRAPMNIAGRTVTNPLEFLFSAKNLYYWTITHVTLSFFPRAVPLPKPT